MGSSKNLKKVLKDIQDLIQIQHLKDKTRSSKLTLLAQKLDCRRVLITLEKYPLLNLNNGMVTFNQTRSSNLSVLINQILHPQPPAISHLIKVYLQKEFPCILHLMHHLLVKDSNTIYSSSYGTAISSLPSDLYQGPVDTTSTYYLGFVLPLI